MTDAPASAAYEKAYDSAIWNRKRAVDDARRTIVEEWDAKGFTVLEESRTFTIQTFNVPPIEHSFGTRPGYSYWRIRAVATVIVPKEVPA
jgi:hypothetical protein